MAIEMHLAVSKCAFWRELPASKRTLARVTLSGRNWRHLPSVQEGFGVAFLDWQADYAARAQPPSRNLSPTGC